MSKDTISRERLEAPPGTIYAETILEPSHLFMLEHYFSPLASTNKAWTVMLVETGIVDDDRGAALLDAILDLEAAGPEAIGDFDPRYEYFYSHVGDGRGDRPHCRARGGTRHGVESRSLDRVTRPARLGQCRAGSRAVDSMNNCASVMAQSVAWPGRS